jgi:hypothetical protein
LVSGVHGFPRIMQRLIKRDQILGGDSGLNIIDTTSGCCYYAFASRNVDGTENRSSVDRSVLHTNRRYFPKYHPLTYQAPKTMAVHVKKWKIPGVVFQPRVFRGMQTGIYILRNPTASVLIWVGSA